MNLRLPTTPLKDPITFSSNLAKAIVDEINCHATALGDDLDGVEEVVGDNLTGTLHAEYSKLIHNYGFDSVSKEIKKKFL